MKRPLPKSSLRIPTIDAKFNWFCIIFIYCYQKPFCERTFSDILMTNFVSLFLLKEIYWPSSINTPCKPLGFWYGFMTRSFYYFKANFYHVPYSHMTDLQAGCLKYSGIGKRIILNWILKEQDKSGLNYFDSGQGEVTGFYKQFQEHSCSVKLGNFLTNIEYLSFSTRTLQCEVCLFACYSWQICLLYHNICKSLSHATKAKSSVKQLFRCFVTSVRLQVGCQLHDIPFTHTVSNE
jgi:hypothetical protein